MPAQRRAPANRPAGLRRRYRDPSSRRAARASGLRRFPCQAAKGQTRTQPSHRRGSIGTGKADHHLQGGAGGARTAQCLKQGECREEKHASESWTEGGLSRPTLFRPEHPKVSRTTAPSATHPFASNHLTRQVMHHARTAARSASPLRCWCGRATRRSSAGPPRCQSAA
jgi:hypothetical protein